MAKQLEQTIGGLFKSAPPLPKGAKESFAKAAPWVAVIAGVLQLMAAWDSWSIMRVADRMRHNVEVLNQYYTKETVHSYGLAASDRFVIYLGVVLLAASAISLLMAFSELQKRTRRGWELAFRSGVLYAAYLATSLFIPGGTKFDAVLIKVVVVALGFYVLFQVREKFNGKSA